MFYLRMARAVFEGTSMVNAKGSNGHHGVKTRISVEQRVKALVSKKKKGFHP